MGNLIYSGFCFSVVLLKNTSFAMDRLPRLVIIFRFLVYTSFRLVYSMISLLIS
mgnify:CR=1 FL=1